MGLLERWLDARGPRWEGVARRLHLREVLGHNALVLLALWGLAVAQPLLDLFGQNPEFFVVNDLSDVEVVLFALMLTIVAPALLVVVELAAFAVARRVGEALHSLLVAVLATALGFTLLGQLGVEDDVIVYLVGGFVGIALAYAERTSRPLRTGLHYLAFGPVLFLVAFLAFSPTAELLRGDGVAAVSPGRVGRPAPVVVLSLDEFPVATLLRADGTINAERFPNFARLAVTSSWFRNATSVASTTTESVPAMLTGRLPEAGLLSTARDHPRNLFTLLGGAYEQHASEQVTDVCPNALCGDDDGGRLDYRRLRTALNDAAAVYAQAAMPPSVRRHLPAVDRSWGGFIADANADDPSDALFDAVTASEVDAGQLAGPTGADCPDIELWCGTARISEMIDGIGPSGRPGLYFTHATLPHAPWIMSATGLQYGTRTLNIPGVEIGGTWTADPFIVRQSFQRHVLQVGHVDRLLGRLIDRLEDEGQWDDAMVVVVADHGVAFRPGEPLRAPVATTLHEIYNIPLFIKFPGQREGEVRSGNALNIDVLPTIVDALDITTDWEFDGESLVEGRPHRGDKPAIYNGRRTFAPVEFDGVLEVVRRNEDYLPEGDGWMGVAAVGPYADLVGRPVDRLDLGGGVGPAWTVDRGEVLADWDPDGDHLAPLLLDGRLEVGSSPPEDALVVVNGTVAGAAGDFAVGDDGRAGFSALIAEETLRRGRNTLLLLVPSAPGSRTFSSAPLTS